VLAPRGWHCLGLEGSDASSLVITPEPHGFADRHDLRGPAVLITLSFGGTSGRFAVAGAIARYFPSKRDFANQVADDGLMEGPMPSGPYPADRIERPSANVVRFTTPAGTHGQGTDSLLAVTADPVLGAVLLVDSDDEPNLIQVSVRLPVQDRALAERIVDQVQLDNADGR
jgi:hypothetical protein